MYISKYKLTIKITPFHSFFAPEQIKGNDIGVRCGLMLFVVYFFCFDSFLCLSVDWIWSDRKRWTSITRYTKPFYGLLLMVFCSVLFLMFVFVSRIFVLKWKILTDGKCKSESGSLSWKIVLFEFALILFNSFKASKLLTVVLLFFWFTSCF